MHCKAEICELCVHRKSFADDEGKGCAKVHTRIVGAVIDRLCKLILFLTNGVREVSDDSTAIDQLDHHRYDRQDQQDVNKSTHGVSGHHSQHPHHDEN